MRLAKALSDVESRKVQSLILGGGVITTLAIWTKLEDPINLPKMFVLVLSASVVFGLSLPALVNGRKLTSGIQQAALGLIALFVIGLLLSAFATDVKYTAIFGEYHRNNGTLSYLGASIFLASSALVFNLDTSKKFIKAFANLGLVISLYGLLQVVGLDPIDWVIIYNPVITTLGNPNFTSGILGLTFIAILLLILEEKNLRTRAVYSIALFLDLFILVKSKSVQGIFALLIGVGVLVLTKIWVTNKKYGFISLGLSGLLGLPIALAVLNIGPLASRLYQGSLGNRLDYWHAAINMFKSQPIFGVGVDRYGEYYREFAVQNQVAQGQVTDNAHSVYLQLLATGGLSTFIPYLLLMCFITYVGFRKLFSATEQTKIRVSGILGIWLGTLVLNLVTIDNLGVGVWSWIAGGLLIAVSTSNDVPQTLHTEKNNKISKQRINNSQDSFPFQIVVAAISAILIIVTLVPSLDKSSTLYNLKSSMGGFASEEYVSKLMKEFRANQNDPQYLIQLGNLALQQNSSDSALAIIERVNQIDPRSYYGNLFPALTYETLEKRNLAIVYRERLMTLDPWNNASLIELIKNYLSVGEKASAEEIVALIKRNYPGSQSDIDASALLVG
jgi:O-antigen ligase